MSLPSFILGSLTGVVAVCTYTDKETRETFRALISKAYKDIQKGINTENEDTTKEENDAQNT